ncbi:MAG: DUF3783 domain-containing protein [Spirochaetia bacterium]|nr:DUF3783 domain-containing protein [Spirochaetia bacterium]
MSNQPENTKNPDERMVLIHGFSREETIAIMRAAKSVSSDPQGIAFTTSTPSNIEWKLRDVIAEVREEHEYMRKNPPQTKGSENSSQGQNSEEGAE